MNFIVPAGILIAICGIYLSLRERTGKLQSSVPESDPSRISQLRVSRPAIFNSLAFCGLAMAGLSYATPDTLETTSPVVSGMRGTVFFFGAGLTLAGALGAILAQRGQMVVLSLAMLGTGVATVLGVFGNAIAGMAALAGSAACGWWLHSQNRSSSRVALSKDDPATTGNTISELLDGRNRPAAEPLLSSIAAVSFCWILGATLHSAVVEENNKNSEMNGSTRSLPRVAYEVNSRKKAASNHTAHKAEATAMHSYDYWLFWCAAGLLVATVGLGYSRSENETNVGLDVENN